MLNPDKNHLQQKHAAWAIGTAVKNDFDFQLWLLESDYTHPSKLVLKKNNKAYHDYNVNNIDVSTVNENDNTDINNKEKNDNVKNCNINSYQNEQNNNALSVSIQNVNETSDLNVKFVEGEKKLNNDELKSEKSNDNKIDLNKRMTGLEKLVSLLHYSSIMSRNVNTSVENRGNMDELQQKVLYAISSAAYGNNDIQDALLAVKKENLYDIKSYFKQNDEIFDDDYDSNNVDKNDQNNFDYHDYNAGIKNSVFLNYLIDIANSKIQKKDKKNSNDVFDDIPSYDIIRQVWAFIAEMLDERAYFRGDFLKAMNHPESVMNHILSTVIFGDIFLTQNWFNLASKNYERIHELNINYVENLDNITEIEINNNGEMENGDLERENRILLASDKLRKRNAKATLENILLFFQEIMSQNNEIDINDRKDTTMFLICLLQNMKSKITSDRESLTSVLAKINDSIKEKKEDGDKNEKEKKISW